MNNDGAPAKRSAFLLPRFLKQRHVQILYINASIFSAVLPLLSPQIGSLCSVGVQAKWHRDSPTQEKPAHKTEEMVNFD